MKTTRIIVLALTAATLSGTAVPVLANEKAKVPPVHVEHEDGEEILVHKGKRPSTARSSTAAPRRAAKR